MITKYRCLVFTSVCLLGLMSARAQSPAPLPSPGPDQKKLEVYLGKWQVEGEAKESPYGPAGKFSSRDTTEWLPGGFFFTHRADGRQGSVEVRQLEVVGYDARNKVYTSRTFDNFGNAGSWKGTVQGNTWTWTGESIVAGKPLQERCTVVFATNVASYNVKCDYSPDGRTWTTNVELKGTRSK